MNALVIGYSGHAFVVIDTILSVGHKVIGYCDQTQKINNPYHLNYFGNETDVEVLNSIKNLNVFLGLGDNKLREKIYHYLCNNKIICPSIIHQKAIVSPMVKIGNGSVIMPGSIINALTTIGKGVICNSGSIVEHECEIGNFSHIAPGAVLAGNVKIGEGTFVGANAVIKQGIIIGNKVIIGAGAVVTKNVDDGVTIYGNPAIKK